MWKQVLQPGTWAKQTKWRWSQIRLVLARWLSFIIQRCTNSSFLIAGLLCPDFPPQPIHRGSAKYQFKVPHDQCWDYIYSLLCFPRLQLCFLSCAEGQLFLFYCISCRDRFWTPDSPSTNQINGLFWPIVCFHLWAVQEVFLRSANSSRFLYQGNSTWSWTADEYAMQPEVVLIYRMIFFHSREHTQSNKFTETEAKQAPHSCKN